MDRARTFIPRSRVPLHRRAFLEPAALRYWLGVVALAVVLAGLVHRATSDAEAQQRRWGTTGDVLVTVDAPVNVDVPVNVDFPSASRPKTSESHWKRPKAVRKRPKAVRKHPKAVRTRPKVVRKLPKAVRKPSESGDVRHSKL